MNEANANCATIEVDRQGIIRAWSEAARALFGFDADEILGRSIELIIPPEFRARHRAGFARFVHSGESSLPEIADSTGLGKDGARLRLAISVEAIRNGAGEIIGVAARIKRAK